MKLKRVFCNFILCVVLWSCSNSTKQKSMNVTRYAFDLQAHRGGAAILPENSLEAFQKAIDFEVNTLELDVVISKDSLVVVSHEAYMRPGMCKTPAGEPIRNKEEFNLFKMNYSEIKSFDCGSLGNPKFPDQNKLKTYKPLLAEVLQLTTENFRKKRKRVSLNIEIKSSPQTDGIYHPKPEEFVRLVTSTIKNASIPLSKITIQSFDKRIIKEMALKHPRIKTAFLVAEGNIHENIADLRIVPAVYSPYFKLLDSVQVKQAHDMGLKVVPWTVNDLSDMQNLLEMGVDGIITDYPNLAKPLHKN